MFHERAKGEAFWEQVTWLRAGEEGSGESGGKEGVME